MSQLTELSINAFIEWFNIHEVECAPETARRLNGYITNLKLYRNSKFYFILYKYDQQYVGYRTYFINGKTMQLDMIFVEDSCRNKPEHIGSLLMRRALDLALENNCIEIEATLSTCNAKNILDTLVTEYKLKNPLLKFYAKWSADLIHSGKTDEYLYDKKEMPNYATTPPPDVLMTVPEPESTTQPGFWGRIGRFWDEFLGNLKNR